MSTSPTLQFLRSVMETRQMKPEPAVLRAALTAAGHTFTFQAVYLWFTDGGIGERGARALRETFDLSAGERAWLNALVAGDSDAANEAARLATGADPAEAA